MAGKVKLTALDETERAFFQMCGDAGEFGCVVPNGDSEKAAETLTAMKLLRRETKHAFTLTPAGRALLASGKVE